MILNSVRDKRMITHQDAIVNIDLALIALRRARDCLKAAECPNALARVRAAIGSTEGALRNQATRDAYPNRKRVKTAKRRNLHPSEMVTLTDPLRMYAGTALAELSHAHGRAAYGAGNWTDAAAVIIEAGGSDAGGRAHG